MKRGRKRYNPTDEERKQVEAYVGLGVLQNDIALMFGIDNKTLRKYYEKELSVGKIKANTKVAGCLFRKATVENDLTAMIWWTKAQMGWHENKQMAISNPDGTPLFTGIKLTLVDSGTDGLKKA